MKKQLFLFAILFFIPFINYSQTPSWSWAKSEGSAGIDYGNSICTDINGNVFVTGAFSRNINYGGVSLANAGETDIFIAKYDNLGNVLWAKSIGGKNNDLGKSITTDPAGNVYVAGNFLSDSIIFGSIVLKKINSAGEEMFVAKYDALGNVIWAKKFGGNYADYVKGIAYSNGSVYLTGEYRSTAITFGSSTLTNFGYQNIFLVKLNNSSGNVLWARKAGGNSIDYVSGITTDATGNIHITGGFYSDDFYIGSISHSGVSNYLAYYLASYNSSGSSFSSKSIAGFQDIEGMGIRTDVNGDLLVTGTYNGSGTSFDSYNLTNNSTNGGKNMFLVKYSTNSGLVLWAKNAGGASYDVVSSIDIDTSGIYIAGNMHSNKMYFGGDSITNSGAADVFILKYDNFGNEIWARHAGGSTYDEAQCIAVDNNQNVYITGMFEKDGIVFGSDTLLNDTLGNTPDIFVAKLGSNIPIGINELSIDNFVSIYPNPSSGLFNFKSLEAGNIIEIYNITGELIYKTISNSTDEILNIEGQAKGLYLFRVMNKRNQIQQGKIIIQ